MTRIVLIFSLLLVFSGCSPPEDRLVNAAREDNLAKFKRLAKPGVNLDKPEQRMLGYTPLYAATLYTPTNVFMFLLQSKADLNARNRDGETPAMGACISRNPEKFLLLIKAGASLTATDKDGVSVLEYARRSGDSRIIAIAAEYGPKKEN
jgi:ankyrin repeat protein